MMSSKRSSSHLDQQPRPHGCGIMAPSSCPVAMSAVMSDLNLLDHIMAYYCQGEPEQRILPLCVITRLAMVCRAWCYLTQRHMDAFWEANLRTCMPFLKPKDPPAPAVDILDLLHHRARGALLQYARAVYEHTHGLVGSAPQLQVQRRSSVMMPSRKDEQPLRLLVEVYDRMYREFLVSAVGDGHLTVHSYFADDPPCDGTPALEITEEHAVYTCPYLDPQEKQLLWMPESKQNDFRQSGRLLMRAFVIHPTGHMTVLCSTPPDAMCTYEQEDEYYAPELWSSPELEVPVARALGLSQVHAKVTMALRSQGGYPCVPVVYLTTPSTESDFTPAYCQFRELVQALVARD